MNNKNSNVFLNPIFCVSEIDNCLCLTYLEGKILHESIIVINDIMQQYIDSIEVGSTLILDGIKLNKYKIEVYDKFKNLIFSSVYYPLSFSDLNENL